MRFSTHSAEGLGKKYVDNAPLWLKTEDMVRQAMRNGGINFVEVPGEAAFYGPKIDVQIWSAIGREFSLATNQVDFAQPLRFDLKFTNKAGQDEMPLVIHRAPLSTHERMVGFLLEHYAGAFPAWLAPVQAVVIPITDRHVEFARQVQARLFDEGFRVEVDDSASRMQAKIREAQNQKDTVHARRRRQGAAGRCGQRPAEVGRAAWRQAGGRGDCAAQAGGGEPVAAVGVDTDKVTRVTRFRSSACLPASCVDDFKSCAC